jgi:hypothetical protein
MNKGEIAAVLVLSVLGLSACGGGSGQSGDAKACAIFNAWNNATAGPSKVLYAWHGANTQPLIGDLRKLSNDILKSEISPGQQSAQNALAQADQVQADCRSLGH